METGMAGVYLIQGFVVISLVLGFWKLVGMAIDQMRYHNNRD